MDKNIDTLQVHTNKSYLYRILSNFITNAIKYSGGTSIEIGCGLKHKNEKSYLKFYVTDNGYGLDEDEINTIFLPFKRLSKHIGKEDGSGIGLYNCRTLAHSIGGTTGVESSPNLGASFWVEIPTQIKINPSFLPITLVPDIIRLAI